MSIKVIHIDSLPEGPFTVDTTLVTADTIEYTADLTLYFQPNSNDHVLTVIPRFYTTDVKLYLWNELKSEETVLTCAATENNGYLDIPFGYFLGEGDSIETKVTDLSGKLMWRGKIYATSQTDLENFTLNPKTNSNIIKI